MVSVIVPVYNVEKYLPNCIESICQQTLSELEIILVDDGSTDCSGELCDQYAKLDNRIVVIHKENGGHTSARNAGLKAARGEYIGFVDSDDWLDNTMYEDMLSICKRENADVAVCSSSYWEYTDRTSIKTNHLLQGIYQAEEVSFNRLLQNLIYSEDYSEDGFPPCLWSYLMRKDLVCKYQLWVDRRIQYGEDAVCVYSCLIAANKVAVVNKAYYHHRLREGSICSSTDERYFERITALYQQLKAQFERHPSSVCLMEQMNRYMLDLVVRGINKMFGFKFNTVIPFYFPPNKVLRKIGMKKIVLHGAGEVGQSYYRWFQMTQSVEIVAWTDRQWQDYSEKGFPTKAVSEIAGMDYDGVLIAVLDSNTAAEIKKTLFRYGVPAEKVLYDKPQNLLQNLNTCCHWQEE